MIHARETAIADCNCTTLQLAIVTSYFCSELKRMGQILEITNIFESMNLLFKIPMTRYARLIISVLRNTAAI